VREAAELRDPKLLGLSEEEVDSYYQVTRVLRDTLFTSNDENGNFGPFAFDFNSGTKPSINMDAAQSAKSFVQLFENVKASIATAGRMNDAEALAKAQKDFTAALQIISQMNTRFLSTELMELYMNKILEVLETYGEVSIMRGWFSNEWLQEQSAILNNRFLGTPFSKRLGQTINAVNRRADPSLRSEAYRSPLQFEAWNQYQLKIQGKYFLRLAESESDQAAVIGLTAMIHSYENVLSLYDGFLTADLDGALDELREQNNYDPHALHYADYARMVIQQLENIDVMLENRLKLDPLSVTLSESYLSIVLKASEKRPF
jgi:hypothetical protein